MKNKKEKKKALYLHLTISKTSHILEPTIMMGEVPSIGSHGICSRNVICWIKGHHIYMDNFFISPTLFEDLANVKTWACDTFLWNRSGIPDTFKAAKPKKGKPPVTTKNGGSQFISWMDHNLVTLLSTVHINALFIKRTRSHNAEDGFVERESLMPSNYI